MKNKIIKAQYPSSFKKDEYIELLTSEYLEKYFKFLPEQIRTPIKKTVDCIEHYINEFKDPKYQIYMINYIKNLTKIKDNEMEDLPQWVLTMLDYIRKDEETVRYTIEELSEIKLPDDKEQYLEFVSQVTKKIIEDICLATETKIPHAAKIEYQRSINKTENANTKLEKSSQSLVEKIDKRKVESFVAEHQERQSKKVHFSQKTEFSPT